MLPFYEYEVTFSKQNEWVIPPAERAKFEDLFKKSDADHDGFITGEQAKALFSRSGLPNAELGKIWVLSDMNQDQRLDRQEFYIAMALINRRLSGREIPVALPEALTISARGGESAPNTPATGGSVPRKGNYDISFDDIEPLSNGPTPGQSPALHQGVTAAVMGAEESTPITSPNVSNNTPRFNAGSIPNNAAGTFGQPSVLSPSIPNAAAPAAYPTGLMSPPIMAGQAPPQPAFASGAHPTAVRPTTLYNIYLFLFSNLSWSVYAKHKHKQNARRPILLSA